MARSDVLERFEACLERYELSHCDIGIELTESVLIAVDSRIFDKLRRLHHRGSEDRHRRFRHRLLVLELSQALSHHRDQD